MNFSCSITAFLSTLGLVGFIGVGHHYRHDIIRVALAPVEELEEPDVELFHQRWHKGMGARRMCKQKCKADDDAWL